MGVQEKPAMASIFNRALGAGRHMAVWAVWQSTGTSLLEPRR
jgi:hypothetical protein